MMSKITVKGKYTGASSRGVIIGGVHLINNGQVHTMLVDEQCYNTLLVGEKNGWFKMVSNNYDMFCASRLRPIPAKEENAEMVEKQVEEKVEVPAEEKAEKPVEEKAEKPAKEKTEKPAKEKAAKSKASSKKED